jgi:hypothetical protein
MAFNFACIVYWQNNIMNWIVGELLAGVYTTAIVTGSHTRETIYALKGWGRLHRSPNCYFPKLPTGQFVLAVRDGRNTVSCWASFVPPNSLLQTPSCKDCDDALSLATKEGKFPLWASHLISIQYYNYHEHRQIFQFV